MHALAFRREWKPGGVIHPGGLLNVLCVMFKDILNFVSILCSASTVSFSVAEDTQSVKGGPDPTISCHIMFEESNLCEE